MPCTSSYYVRSIACLLGLSASGCASASSIASRAPVVAFAEATRHPEPLTKIGREPIVLRFEAGDRIPVEVDLNSQLMHTDKRPLPFEVVATRRFYVLIDPDFHVRTSLDGRDFEARPKNAFQLGLAVTRDAAKVVIALRIRPQQGS
jgi:hypothetical protein